MNGFSNWLRNLGTRFSYAMRRFMMGRYGTDKLNTALLSAGVILCVVALLVKAPALDILLSLGSYVFLGIVIFRSLSRNTYKRYQENRKYLMLLQRFQDKEHRYFDCPRCRQQVRVPKGKGKISITCPKCKEKFIKKT